MIEMKELQRIYEEMQDEDVTTERTEEIKKVLQAEDVLIAFPALNQCGHPLTHIVIDVDEEEHEMQIWRLQTVNQNNLIPFTSDADHRPTVHPITGQRLIVDDD